MIARVLLQCLKDSDISFCAKVTVKSFRAIDGDLGVSLYFLIFPQFLSISDDPNNDGVLRDLKRLESEKWTSAESFDLQRMPTG
jgi:hypothetical protein